MLVKVTGATVSVVVPAWVPEVAEITDEPSDTPVARPLVVILAMAGVAEVKLEIAVMSLLLPSVYVPIAINCCAMPIKIDGLAGNTAIDTNVTGVTDMFAMADLPPNVAVMTDVPMAALLAIPVALLMVATATLPDDQAVEGVTSTEAPSA